MIRRLLVASTLGVLSSALLVSVAIAGSITVPYPAEDPALQLTFSETGGTLSAAKLTEPRFSRDLRPAMEGVPVDQTDVGPIDLVTTWSDNFYPLRLLFNHLSVAGVAEIQIGAVERASIDGTLLTPEEGPKAPSPAAGDLIRVKAPANLAGDYTVSGVMDSGAVALTSTTGLNNAKSSEVSYTIHRRGEVGTLYAQGPKFKRIGSGDQLPFTFVWPNPETDKSPLYIERRFEPGKHEYEIAMKVAIHNVSPAEVKAQIGIDVTGWQHPALAEMSMFMAPPDLYAASCLTGDSYEREDYTELWECSDGGGCTEQPVSFTTPTEWVGIETRYMLLGVVAESLTGAQCRLTASPTAPTLGTGVVSATLWAGTTHTIRGHEDGCVPEWLKGVTKAPTCSEAATALGLEPNASVKDLRAAWQLKREEIGQDPDALYRAWKSIKNRRRALYRFSVYAGPKHAKNLAVTGRRVDASLDFGVLEFIGKPMLAALSWFYDIAGHWALAIVLLTIIMKTLLFPITNKSFKSMQAMSSLRPKLDELKKKYEGDQQAFAKAQMALFKKEGVNPFSSCLPMFLQMPVWFAFYQVIYSSVELYHAPLGGWIPDLSAPDPLYIFPVILGVLMFAQSYFQPTAAGMDPVQAKMMKYGMPLMFSVMMISLPSGLVLYIMVNTIITIIQQIYIRRSMA